MGPVTFFSTRVTANGAYNAGVSSGPIESDPRLPEGIRLFNDGAFLEAGDLFEELFFEAIVGELEFARVLLQVSAGCLHAEQRQFRPAVERLGEAVLAIDQVRDDRGYDLEALRSDVTRLIGILRDRRVAESGWPLIRRK